MSKVQTRFGVLGVADNGTAAALPILFLHGVGSDKTVWDRQLRYFRGKRAAIAIDYPGYGESELRPGATRDDYARVAAAALDALGHPRAHICGLSLGGVVAIAFHALAPERCASLILADTFAVHPEGHAIYDRSVAASADMAKLAEARTPVLLAPDAPAGLHAEVRATMSAINPAAFRVGARAVWLADQRERARTIDVSTLVLCGEADTVTPPALSRSLAEAISGARLEIIAGAGHLANIEQPDAFNFLIEQFIEEVERG